MAALKPATVAQRAALDRAVAHLRLVVADLAAADCPATLERARLALSSAKGAVRHMDRRFAATVKRQQARPFADMPASMLESLVAVNKGTARGIAAAAELTARGA